jgi:regulator of sirC expression with transglutaminase-like and TPR domain
MEPRSQERESDGAVRGTCESRPGADAPCAARPRRGTGSERARSLVALLADENPAVERAVVTELVAADRSVLPFLAEATRSDDGRLRGRARLVLERRRFEHHWRRLVAHLSRRQPDLETGLLRLGALAPDGVDPRPTRRRLERLARTVARRIDGKPDSLARTFALVEVLCTELGYTGAENDYHHPSRVWLHRALSERLGLPLTLVAIHILVARRLGLAAKAVPIPGHVLLRLSSGRRSLLVDPFHGGAIRSRNQVVEYLRERGLPVRESWFADADDRHLLRRQVWNLHRSFKEQGWHARAARLRAAGGLLEGLRGAVTTADTEGA